MTCKQHAWDDHWHMGHIIGTVCKACGYVKLRSAAWCQARMELVTRR